MVIWTKNTRVTAPPRFGHDLLQLLLFATALQLARFSFSLPSDDSRKLYFQRSSEIHFHLGVFLFETIQHLSVGLVASKTAVATVAAGVAIAATSTPVAIPRAEPEGGGIGELTDPTPSTPRKHILLFRAPRQGNGLCWGNSVREQVEGEGQSSFGPG